MDKLLIIDGNSILNRAFYGISGSNLLKTKEGIFTNAIYGFLAIIMKVINQENPTHIGVAFDLKAPTFRHKQYEEYKAGRHKMPDELAMQLPIIKDVLREMNIAIYELEGYEADDIIGTIAKKFSKDNIKVAILTGDRDSFQLVDNNIYIKLPHTKMGQTVLEDIDENAIKEKYGLNPLQMIELKALMGDSSDNIPGIPGVGEKTALNLIQTYNSVDGLYEFLDNNPEQKDIKGKMLEKITDNKDKAYLSRTLGEIFLEVPINFKNEDLTKKEYNYIELYKILKKLELKSFIQKFDLEKYADNLEENSSENFNENIELIKIENENQIQNLVNEIDNKKIFAYYFLEKDRYKFEDINNFTFAIENKVYIINKNTINKDTFIKYFKPIFESKEIKKIGFDTKSEYLMLDNLGINFNNMFFDVLIAEYLLEPIKNKYELKDMLDKYLGITLKQIDKKEEQITFDLGFGNENKNDNNEEEYENLKTICYGIFKLKNVLEKKLEQNNQLKLFNEIEMKLIEVLSEMEIEGVKIDKDILNEINLELEEKISILEKEIYEIADCTFNINSPKQLGEILFEKLKLPVIKKNKTGYSTDVEVLEKLEDEHKIISKILEYRQVIKLKTTYVDGLRQYIDDNGIIHSKLNQTVTATGRLSSTDPNLQNIPVRTDYGKNLRKMFISKDGYTLVDADYSQIELRVLAHIANDSVMINAFNNDIDIHKTTAMQVFDLKENDVTSKERSQAKAVNFGIVYGISDFGLAKQIGKSVREAKEYINRYLEKYEGIKKFMEDAVDFAKENGYVETLFNRRRYISEITSSNYNIRQFGQRVAINTPIQGTAADIIKIAMIKVYEELKTRKLKSKLIMQIHDELIIEAYNEEVEEVEKILVESMENAIKLNVPLKVEAKTGKSWFETK